MLRRMLCIALMLALLIGSYAYAGEPLIAQKMKEMELAKAGKTYIVPYGQVQMIGTQILPDGSAHTGYDNAECETVYFTICVKGNRGPGYFNRKYAKSYTLKGDEAVVEFEITLNDYNGSCRIIPSSIILVTMRGADEDENQTGYMLTNYEIDGESNVEIVSNYKVTLYKRYTYDENLDNRMEYMAVNTFNDGVMDTYLFEINDPNGTEDSFSVKYQPLSRKNQDSEAVCELQKKLIDLGLLHDYADGDYGKKTEKAVMDAQKLLGMEATGLADVKFQRALDKYIEEKN